MIHREQCNLNLSIRALFALLVLCGDHVGAQENFVAPRIIQAIDETKLTILKGNTYPRVREQFDRGPAPSNLPLNRMLLVLQRPPRQESSLKSLLGQQQQKSSTNHHQWLTPEQFGQQFGAADQDIQTITSWLSSHGFQIGNVAKNKLIVEFSGTAGQVKEAFHTDIHQYEFDRKQYWANSSDPAIPTALTPVVAGIVSLHNLGRQPRYRTAGIFSRDKQSGRYKAVQRSPRIGPLFDVGPGCGIDDGGCYGVGPYDFATIYNSLPLWNAATPIDGRGETIAIVSQSDIYTQDFNTFRKDFDLPPTTLNIINNGPDPGKLASEGDELESDLDTEWAGAVAKGATIDLVVSATTNTTAGVDLSALYIVDNNLAPIISDSYGGCELDMGTTGNLFYNELWQQAAAEGISVFVAAGDSGSDVCDRDAPIATQGLSVDGVSSTPYDVAVGGTDFDDAQAPSNYWSSTNNPKTLESALSYIPERTWNDTCTNSEFVSFDGETSADAECNNSTSSYWPYFLVPVGGSGGASNCTTSSGQSASSCSSGYSKPLWQTGLGVPNDGSRDVPDVSLFAADGVNGSFYLVCESDVYDACVGNSDDFIAIGGTSASAPAFAGIMAMVNQKTRSRQGLANYVLYPLAAQAGASCNSSGTISSSCIFYDVTTGTIAMPCATGSLDCTTNINGDQNGVLSGFSTTPGFDLATGLGSVNITNLVNNWDTVSFQPTASTLALNPTTQIIHGSPVNVNIGVVPQTGSGTPTGLVSLLTSAGPGAGIFTLANGSVTGSTTTLPGGSYTVTAHYDGDGTYAASDSSPGIAVTVNAEPSITTLQAFTLDQNLNVIPFTSGPYGSPNLLYLSATVAGQSGQGVPTGSVNLTQTISGITSNLPGNPFALNAEAYTMNPLPGGAIFFTPGTYSIAGAYSGDKSFKANSSSPITFTITQAPTTVSTDIVPCTLGSTQCSLAAGTSVEMFGSAESNQSPFANLPTGTMTFYSNGVALGPPVALQRESPPVASFSTSNLPLGADNITVQYSGDANFSGSTSPTTFLDVGGTFTISANPSVITIASPGQSGSTTLTFTAQNGLTGSATLSPSICSQLPPKSTCSFNPASVNFTASTVTAPVTFTIATAASSSVIPSGKGLLPNLPGTAIILLAYAVALGAVFQSLLRRGQYGGLSAVFGLVLIATALSCGGGSSGNGPSNGSGGGLGGTPTGNYQGISVEVSINGVTQTINNLTVDVQ